MKRSPFTLGAAVNRECNSVIDGLSKQQSPDGSRFRRHSLAIPAASLLILSVITCVAMGAGKTNSPPSQEYQAFKLIAERNIFNPNRQPGLVQGPPPKVEKQSKTEAFALVGTLIDGGEALAFFDGSDAQYKKVLKPTEVIAGYKVLEISIEEVKLESEGNEVKLPIGMQMKRKDADPWQLIAVTAAFDSISGSSDSSRSESARGDSGRSDSRRGDPRRSYSRRSDGSSGQSLTSASSSETSTSDTQPASTSSGDADEVLKRLMQKREDELNKGKP